MKAITLPRMWRAAYALIMLASVFSPLNPRSAPLGPAIVALGVFVLGVLAMLRVTRSGRLPSINASGAGLAAFLGMIVISLPVALLQGTSARDWLFRGATPLLFFLLYFLLPVHSRSDASFVIRTLVTVSFVWAGKIFVALLGNLSLLGDTRWTALAKDLLLPFNLLALAILCFDSAIRPAVRIIGMPVFLLLTLGAGYRSQLILIGIMTVAAVSHLSGRQRLWALVGAGCLVGGMSFVSATLESGTLIERFRELGQETESGRAREIEFALDQFKSSPVYGKGLGFSIPVEITFAGREDYLRRIANREGSYNSVAYMHNVVMYLLMTSGIIGLASFALFVGGAFSARTQLLTVPERRACKWALGMLVAFTLAAATFTLFQYNLMVASLVAVLSAKGSMHDDRARATTT